MMYDSHAKVTGKTIRQSHRHFYFYMPKSQAKPYAKVTGIFISIRQSYRQNHTPKSQAANSKIYAKVTDGCDMEKFVYIEPNVS